MNLNWRKVGDNTHARYIIPTLDTTNREDVIEWIISEATSDMGWYVSATDNDITVTVTDSDITVTVGE